MSTLIESSLQLEEVAYEQDAFSITYIYDATEWSQQSQAIILDNRPTLPTTDIYFMLNKGYTLGSSDAFDTFAQGIGLGSSIFSLFDSSTVPMLQFVVSYDVRMWIVNESYLDTIAVSDVATLDKTIVSDVEFTSTVPGASNPENQEISFDRNLDSGSFSQKYGILIGFENISGTKLFNICNFAIGQNVRVYPVPVP